MWSNSDRLSRPTATPARIRTWRSGKKPRAHSHSRTTPCASAYSRRTCSSTFRGRCGSRKRTTSADRLPRSLSSTADVISASIRSTRLTVRIANTERVRSRSSGISAAWIACASLVPASATVARGMPSSTASATANARCSLSGKEANHSWKADSALRAYLRRTSSSPRSPSTTVQRPRPKSARSCARSVRPTTSSTSSVNSGKSSRSCAGLPADRSPVWKWLSTSARSSDRWAPSTR